jgi:hypothetical protein
MSAIPPLATELRHRGDPPLCAKSGASEVIDHLICAGD